jgi:hypothetical protein
MLEALALRIVLERQRIDGEGGQGYCKQQDRDDRESSEVARAFPLSLRERVPRRGG